MTANYKTVRSREWGDGEKVTPEELEAMVERADELSAQINELHKAKRDLDYRISVAQAEADGMPQEDGWYLDSGGQIARREDGVWHDGWGNRGPDYGHYSPPLTRLVPERGNARQEGD